MRWIAPPAPLTPLVASLLLAACAFQPGGSVADDGDADATAGADARDGGGPSSVDAGGALPPTWASDMTGASQPEFYTRLQPGAVVEVGANDAAASDGAVARLVFRGADAREGNDGIGPTFASELATVRDDFQFGTYRMRVRLASCAAGEEVVNGLFTYFNDGTDHDGDGLVDNSEIDLEILCGTPTVLFLSVWTEYSPNPERFRKWTRAIDLSTGALWDSPSDHEHGLVFAGTDPALARPELISPDHFIELGFEWRADRVRYFATVNGTELTLATLTDAARIPRLPAALMFNVWYPGEHWFGDAGAAELPAHDATLLVDWARYWR